MVTRELEEEEKETYSSKQQTTEVAAVIIGGGDVAVTTITTNSSSSSSSRNTTNTNTITNNGTSDKNNHNNNNNNSIERLAIQNLLGCRIQCTLSDGRTTTGRFICLDRLYVCCWCCCVCVCVFLYLYDMEYIILLILYCYLFGFFLSFYWSLSLLIHLCSLYFGCSFDTQFFFSFYILLLSLNCSPPSTSMVALVDHHEIQGKTGFFTLF